MVDIAMCYRSDCPDKNTCFRYLAFPSELQAYIQVTDPIIEQGKCEFYWRCRTPKELSEMNKLNKGIE